MIVCIVRKERDYDYEKLYVGETGDFDDRVTTSHKKYDCWKREAEKLGTSQLYVTVHSANKDARKGIEEKLIAKYEPDCNVKHNPNHN